MPPTPRRLVLIVISCLLLPLPGRAADEPAANAEETVRLEPFKVDDHSLHIGWRAGIKVNKKSRLITGFTFTAVEPGSLSDKAGLKVGDRLVAIDGHPIVGITTEDYLKLLQRHLAKGETITYAFTIQRGLFRKESVVKIAVTL